MLKRILNRLFPKRHIKYRFTVPPHAEFTARDIKVANDSDELLDIWTRNFPDRRLEVRGERNILDEEEKETKS